jgi:hypothetical protein
VIDHAGNSATVTVPGLNVDTSAPRVTVTGVSDGAVYTVGSVPQPGCTAVDPIPPTPPTGSATPSGLTGPCTGTISGGLSNGVGTFSYRAATSDVAGNTGYTIATWAVHYRFDGFAQPVNDTAHTTGLSTSVFKSGSTIPLKFPLHDQAGNLVTAATAPTFVGPTLITSTSASVNDTAISGAGTAGTAFSYDPTTGTYQFNWQTQKSQAGFLWRVGVRLDDGSVQTVVIGLR